MSSFAFGAGFGVGGAYFQNQRTVGWIVSAKLERGFGVVAVLVVECPIKQFSNILGHPQFESLWKEREQQP